MYGWLKALPADAVRRSPVLNVFYGSMLLHSGDLSAVEPRLDDADRSKLASILSSLGRPVRLPKAAE